MEHNDNWTDLVRSTWNDKAQKWTENSAQMWEAGSRKDILPFIQQHFPEKANILDIGCAGGYSTNKLHELGYSATGMDISEKMIQLAQAQYPNIVFKQGNVMQLPFEKSQFSCLLAINVLEWTTDPAKALRELARIIEPGGTLCIGVLGPTAGPREISFDRLLGETVILNTMMPWEFQKLAEHTGFLIKDQLIVNKQWSSSVQGELPIQARQALSFMTVFMMTNGANLHEIN